MSDSPAATSGSPPLRRDLGIFGATMMGLGSIVGTGIFVSIGIAAEVCGIWTLPAIGIASLVAMCNGLSSAQLAANHPVSGGTYEYGYQWLTPTLGFTAGWMFLCAKGASAATAALGLAGYLGELIHTGPQSRIPVALLGVILLTLIVANGIRRSHWANTLIVSVTLLSLALFVVAGLPTAMSRAPEHLSSFGSESPFPLLQATALMFVAYTGYGRIATLGEEVKEPRRTIPRAIIVTLFVSMALYLGVAFVGLASVGAEAYGKATQQQGAPLETIASQFGYPGLKAVVAIGAITAMMGVLLNLLLGLSRVLLAMARRRDVPFALAKVSEKTGAPQAATIAIALLIGGLVLLGDLHLSWSFSAFSVLIYYAITNLCAIRLRKEERLFPVWPAYCGLVACAFLAFQVRWQIWLSGLGLIAIGLLWQQMAKRFFRKGAMGESGQSSV